MIDVTNPSAPVSRGTLDTPGDAQDVVVNGSRTFVADGVSGLQIIDVTNPQTPTLIGSVDTPGSASGVDVDPQRNLAVVADGASGIQVIDIADIAHPTIVGSVATGNAADVVVHDGFALVADLSSSLTSVDLSNPGTPIVRASTPVNTGGLLNDVAVAGRFAFGAVASFTVPDVPIVDISDPAAPQVGSLLRFPPPGTGTGIAVDSAYVYLTTNGNRLFIGQYLKIEDTAGIPPTVDITSPTAGDTVIEGSSLPVTVDASDDIAIAAVNLLANGNTVATDTAPPYQFSILVPLRAPTLSLGATATDFGGNVNMAEAVVLSVIADTPPTIVITTPSEGTPLVAGETILLSAEATVDVRVVSVRFTVNGTERQGEQDDFPLV